MGRANSDEICFQYQLLNVEIYSKANWNFIHILKPCHSSSGQHWLLNSKGCVQCHGSPCGICDNSGSGCLCSSGTGGGDTSSTFIAIKLMIIIIIIITIWRPYNTNTVQVECQSNSDTSHNRGNWNYLKIIQTIHEQHTVSTKSENYRKQPY